MRNNIDVVIIGIHQSHVGAKAGGYIRLQEFLKRFPKDISFKIIDSNPTIYRQIVDESKIEIITIPAFITFLVQKCFPLGVLLERIYEGVVLYYRVQKLISNNKVKVLYVPIGEFLHLYLPAILLKKRYSRIKLVVDILNFCIYRKGFFQTLRSFLKKSSNIFFGFAFACISYISFTVIKKTINYVDYIFSVSPELVKTIQEIYHKKTISFTPSGVDSHVISVSNIKKKYLGVYIGRVTEQKGVFNCLDAWEKIILKRPKALLVIAGIITPEVKQELLKKLKEKKLTKNVIIRGEVSEEEKIKIIKESEIFLHLANYEPLFPVIGILEGFAGGLPAVVFDMKVAKTVIKKITNNNFIFVVENDKILKVVEVIDHIASLPTQKRIGIQKNARIYAKTFDWNKIANIEFYIIRKFI